MGEFLAGEREFPTLSRLNRASRALHEETLPVLYETVRIETEEAFTGCVQFANPTGFKYLKCVSSRNSESSANVVPLQVLVSDQHHARLVEAPPAIPSQVRRPCRRWQ